MTLRPWSRWLEWPRARTLAVALAVAVAAPSLGMGLFLDDNVHYVQAGGTVFVGERFDQFRFVTGDPVATMPFVRKGPFPWWTLPELKLSFFRPLSSALITFDRWAFGDRFWLHHVHSIAWYVLLVVAAGLLLGRALPGAAGAGALLLFAIDEAHWFPVAWLANRNALVATAPVLLGVAAHVRWRSGGGARFLAASLLCVTVGLTAGEAALGALAYLVAWEAFAATDGARRRLGALVPVGLLAFGYLLLYRAMGSGAYGSATYVDPLATPWRFLAEAPGRALTLVSGLVFGVNLDAWMAVPASRPVYAALGAGALAAVGWAHVRVRAKLSDGERRGLDWLVAGALLSVVPVLATFPAQRLLLMPSIGGSAFVAALLRALWGHTSKLRRAAAWTLLAVHAGVALVTWPAMHALGTAMGRSLDRVSLESPLGEEAWRGRVVMPVAPDFGAMMLPAVRAREGLEFPARWWILSFGKGDHRLTRTGERRLELELVGGRLLGALWEQQLRSDEHPLAEGETVQLEGARVTALDVVGGKPARIAVDFDLPLDDPAWTFVKWDDFRLVPLALPPVGGSVLLPRQPGVLGP